MFKLLSPLLFIFMIPNQIRSQILPKEGSKLHYRLIGFSFPENDKASNYKVEIAAGDLNTESAFKKNTIVSADSKVNKVIAEVPAFGQPYTWRVVYTQTDATSTAGELHHFSTVAIPASDTDTRIRITTPAAKYKDAYVFIDGTGALYDMNGKAVWYLPDIEGAMKESARVSDLKLTTAGTITFMASEQAYEVNYNGDILWKGPNTGAISGEHTEHYHHEFTRLDNGHYMVLGNEAVVWKPASPDISGYDQKTQDSIIASYPRIPFGNIIEYDEKGNVVWSWHSVNYLKGSDAYYQAPGEPLRFANAHENAFFFDEKNSVIYVSFKVLNRVVKLSYPDGKVINAYGEVFKPGIPGEKNGLYSGQHSCRISQKGYLYLFNNNTADTTSCCSKITMMQEAPNGKNELKKIWEYGYDANDPYPKKIATGGNVLELPDGSIFCGMNRIFIVDMNKNILWSAIPEKWDTAQKKWDILAPYRAGIIDSRKDLENLIWNSNP